ncbi:DUF7916 family protein [Exiguobacterium flavidum]|uniref:DUF7916 family protein n=1 Tax=Exiguobacterium flavidum TaxID=2184695 RepID=UPI000DF832D1|nr:haloacid dehalogenase-like hydrolase [Exiguobacterium flavidum]
MKRLLDCRASDFRGMDKKGLRDAIEKTEGRTVIGETISSVQPLFPEVTNAELLKAFGADMILLNMFDVFNPKVAGLELNQAKSGGESLSVINELKRMTGVPIGINLEPVPSDGGEDLLQIEEGRTPTRKTLEEASKLGFDFICLTGNPKTGVSNEGIEAAVRMAKQHFTGLIIAGKMHGAGVSESVLDLEAVSAFCEAGADIILLPAPGTVPGVRERTLAEAVSIAKKKGVLALAAIGTSQEGADVETVRQIALSAKRAGVDAFHIGDAGYTGIAVPENVMALSIAIRGRRHTYIRMATSPNR